jgi:V/A-type H+-transporting ATPase subunit B
MNTMIRFYSGAKDAEKKQQMAFDLSPLDHKLLKFGELFQRRFMDINVALPLNEALDLCWKTMAECFNSEELLMRENLIEKYFPRSKSPEPQGAAS